MEQPKSHGHQQVMADIPDKELWLRVQHGDAASFSVLFDRYERDIYNMVFRRTASWDAAEEVTSAVFLDAWRRRMDVSPQHMSLRPWLFGVAVNHLRNRSRTLRRREAANSKLRLETEPDFADDVARRLDDEISMRRTLRVFEHLSHADQDVLGLAAWEGLSYEEISLALGIPLGTVRSRIHRGRQHLTELLAEGGHQMDDKGANTSPASRRDES